MSHSTNTPNQLGVSDEGWAGIQQIAQQFQLSVAELLDRIGRGSLAIVDAETLEDYLDLQDALAAESNSENQERVSWEQIKQELGL
ncbi:MAG: hypothetical protein HC769_08880 [Cyanobacteria bacterium CRU_2_1]|nr:hypothetical protein [Cyanobacteria bacterium RU_5_0]NJR58950.1 hypothetical protein [Cyanobacteria bacterium CRU_2_1]